jgi:hypothetical protein
MMILVQFQKSIMLIGMWVVKMTLISVHRVENSTRNWTRDHQSSIMEKNMPVFCP